MDCYKCIFFRSPLYWYWIIDFPVGWLVDFDDAVDFSHKEETGEESHSTWNSKQFNFIINTSINQSINQSKTLLISFSDLGLLRTNNRYALMDSYLIQGFSLLIKRVPIQEWVKYTQLLSVKPTKWGVFYPLPFFVQTWANTLIA